MAIGFPSRAFRRTRERASGLYFAFGVDDLNQTLPTGQVLSLTRLTGRSFYDSTGRVSHVVRQQLAWTSFYNADAGIWEPALDIAPATTNLCLRSQDLGGAGWTNVGTPTLVSAARQIGDLVLDLLGDDAAGTLEGKTRTVSLTGNGVKAVSVFVAQGSSSSSVIRLRDTTAAANRLLQTLTWSGGLPVCSGTGTFIGYDVVRGGFRLRFQSTSATAANTHQIELYPATTSGLVTANTGTLYVGGVQVENAPAPGPYALTAGSTVTSNYDRVSADVVLPVDSDFTVYVRIGKPNWAGLTTGWLGNYNLIGQKGSVSNGVWSIYFDPINQQFRSSLTIGGAGATIPVAIPVGASIDVCAQFRNISSGGSSRIDAGAGFSAWSSAVAPIAAWDSATTYLGGDDLFSIGATIRRAAIAPGLRTLAEMAGLAI